MQEEIFPLVDEDGHVIGQATRSECHSGTKMLHPVIHLHVFDSEGNLFLQKRSKTKDIQPDRWDTSVGGHIDLNEKAIDAVVREAREELGIDAIDPRYITKYIIETDVECELTYCYYAIYDGGFTIDRDEVSDGRFWSIDEVANQLGKSIFTINFELDFNKFLSNGLKELTEK